MLPLLANKQQCVRSKQKLGLESPCRKLCTVVRDATVDLTSTVRDATVDQPSTVRDATVDQPSIVRDATTNQPSIVHDATVERLCGAELMTRLLRKERKEQINEYTYGSHFP